MHGVSIRIPTAFFHKWKKDDPQTHTDLQETLDSQDNVKKRRTKLKDSLSDFKTYDKATVIEIVWYWRKDRYIDQWSRLKNPCMCLLHLQPIDFLIRVP